MRLCAQTSRAACAAQGSGRKALRRQKSFSTITGPMQPGCALRDIILPGALGLQFQAQFNRRHVNPQGSALTGRDEADIPDLAAQLGAHDLCRNGTGDRGLQFLALAVR
jgi:hypothetical protein